MKDWIDRDKLKRLNGAEDDYYRRLNLEYLPKNEPLESLEEAFLIRGFRGFRGFSKKNFLFSPIDSKDNGDFLVINFGIKKGGVFQGKLSFIKYNIFTFWGIFWSKIAFYLEFL